MAVLYEDSFVLLREASALMDQVLLQTADPNASGKIRAAFYKLYQAANSATMISPPDVRAVAEGSEAYRLIVEYPYKLYYREGDVYKRQALNRYEHLLKLKDLYAQA